MTDAPVSVLAPHSLRDALDALPDFRWTEGDDGQMVVVQDHAEWQSLRETLLPIRRSALPLVALSPLPAADRVCEAPHLGDALSGLRVMAQRMANLPQALHRQEDEALGLLAYLSVRDQSLKPVTDPALPRVVDFSERARFPELDGWIERLASEGLIHPVFEERINACPHCGSARLLLRDQCVSCASSNITEQAILHHFACACQAPEKAFRTEEGELRCPKCRRALNHVSVDYEVSADLCECLACGDVTHQPVPGFRCLDCTSPGFGQELIERQIESYALTTAGRARVAPDARPRLTLVATSFAAAAE